MELLTSAQMRAAERATIDGGDVSGAKLMERAALGVVDAVLARWPALAGTGHSAVILCGPGNNGGDGFAIARLLKGAGWQVRVHLFGTPQGMPADAKANHDVWQADNDVLPMTQEAVYGGDRPDLIVDAVFGTGLARPLPDDLARILDVTAKRVWRDWSGVRTVAVDSPSGLDLDRGQVPASPQEDHDAQPFLNAVDLTVTFHRPKVGHYIEDGPMLCGHLEIVDIGLAKTETAPCEPPAKGRVRLVGPAVATGLLPDQCWPAACIGKFRTGGHKFDHGHVIVFAGGVGRGGAGRLAARAALRAGAGLVTLLCPPSALIENACQLDAIMLRALAQESPVEQVVDDRASAFCLGPGMGVSDLTRQRVTEVLARRAAGPGGHTPAVVLDADALTSFADDPDVLFRHTHDRTILTPHEGEFGRLFPDLAMPRRGDLSKVDAARQAAARAGCLILLKGPDTVIASPDGRASVHAAAYDRSAPWLATAGAGDVLAGLIAGLSAPQSSAALFVMAEIAAFVHVEAALRFGPGLIAEDLPEALPGVFRDLIR